MIDAIPADVVCVECREVSVARVPAEALRDDAPEDPYDLDRTDFFSFEENCACSDEPTWHNVVSVLRGRIEVERGESA